MPNLTAWSPQALAVLRIMTALLFLEHGTMKLFGFPAPMPGPLPPLIMAAAAIEIAAGALIALGLFTRIAALVASGEMAVAYFMSHASKSFWPILNMGEAAILFCFVFLFLVFAGPGAWALDNARGRRPAGPGA